MSDEQNLDLDKFFDSLTDDDVDDETKAAALEDEATKDADANDDSKDGDDNSSNEPSLEERMAALEKENKGLKKDIVKVRGDRRETRDKFNRLVGMIHEAKNQGAGSQQDGDKKDAGDTLADLKLAIEYDDDGNPYVPANKIAELIQGRESKLADEMAMTQQRQAAMERANAAQQAIDSVIAKDATFQQSYLKVEDAVKDLNSRIIDLMKASGVKGEVSPAQALSMVEKAGQLEDWMQEHKLQDPDVIAHAFESERNLERALRAMVPAEPDTKDDEEDVVEDKSFKKLVEKPGTHGKSGTKVQESIVEKVGAASTQDILDLDDKAVDALLARMHKEELANL